MKPGQLLHGLLLILWQLMCIPVFSQVIYVNKDASGTNDGSSWENAYNDLHQALTNSADGVSLWIAKGIYHPGGTSPDTNSVFSINHNVSLYGGFAGNESALEERNVNDNFTVLSGDLSNDDVVSEFVSHRSDNTTHVVYVDSMLMRVVFDGLIIKGGHTNIAGSLPLFARAGGGMYALSPITMNNCTITENYAHTGGGVLLAGNASHSTFTNCTFSFNKNTDRGAGIYALSISDLSVIDCTFNDNETVRGALYPNDCTGVNVERSFFRNNHSAAFNGGALFSFSTKDLLISDSEFENNSALAGGAVVINGTQLPAGTFSNIRIEKCFFRENKSTQHAGALFVFNNPDILIRRCDFINDTASNAGALMIEQSLINQTDTNKIRIDSCSFIGNHAAGNIGGGALRLKFSAAKIENCLFDSNSAIGLLDGGGGHVFQICPGKEVIYRNVSFLNGNSGGFAGAAMSNGFDADYLFENCVFENNIAARAGGALHHTFGPKATYKNCVFNFNQAEAGGALSMASDSTEIHVEYSTFSNNVAENDGGAIKSSSGSGLAVIDHCLFEFNEAKTGFGGAINMIEEGNDDISNLALNNSIFSFNKSVAQAGALNLVDANAQITNCLFYENVCSSLGIGAAMSIKATDDDTVETTIVNTTIANNHGDFAAGIAQETQDEGASLTTTIQNTFFRNKGTGNYTIEAGEPKIISLGGNMSDDLSMTDVLTDFTDQHDIAPVFQDELNNDYSLAANSPGIDDGVWPGTPQYDILGNPRVNFPDIGAYENQFPVGTKEQFFNDDHQLAISPNCLHHGLVNLTIENQWRGHLEVKAIGSMGQILDIGRITKNTETFNYSLHADTLLPGQYSIVISKDDQFILGKLIKL